MTVGESSNHLTLINTITLRLRTIIVVPKLFLSHNDVTYVTLKNCHDISEATRQKNYDIKALVHNKIKHTGVQGHVYVKWVQGSGPCAELLEVSQL